MNDINDIMNDIVNDKKGHNIVNEIDDNKAALLTSQTDILWY